MRNKKLNGMVIGVIMCFLFSVMLLQSSYGLNTQDMKVGDYVELGRYNDKPIKWRVIAMEGDSPLLFAEEIITLKPFDVRGSARSDEYREKDGANFWQDSTLRWWLNSEKEAGTVFDDYLFNPPAIDYVWKGKTPYDQQGGFLSYFIQAERDMIRPRTHKVLLADIDAVEGVKDGGNVGHEYKEEIEDVVTNYDEANYHLVTDKVFLLSVKELKEYVYDNDMTLIRKPNLEAISESDFEDFLFLDTIQSEISTEEADELGYDGPSFVDEKVPKSIVYWLRTPNTNVSNGVRFVDESGGKILQEDYTRFMSTWVGGVGVVPALSLKSDISVFMGEGSENDPYKLSLDESETNNETYEIRIDNEENAIEVKFDDIKEIQEKGLNIEVKTPNADIMMPNDVIQNDIRDVFTEEREEKLELKVKRKDEAFEEKIKKMLQNKLGNVVKSANLMEFSMDIVDGEGNRKEIHEFNTPLKITLKDINEFDDLKKTAVYNVIPDYDEEGNIIKVEAIYSGGEVRGNNIIFYPDHFSFYIIMERKATFPDVAESWARASVEHLSSIGIIRGYPDGMFLPNNQVHRVDFSVLLSNSLGKKPMEYQVAFRDINEKDYFAGHVLALNKYGISDVSSSYFKEENKADKNMPLFGVYNEDGNGFKRITREETATFIANAYRYLRTYREELPELVSEELTYTDKDDISNEVMRQNISIAYQLGIMKGYPDGSFRPKNQLTRAEAAHCIVLFMNKFQN